MAGKSRPGLDYSGWSVSLFDGDTKIDKLLDAQGWLGFGIYFYLCQMAYKFDGYFYRWSYDDAATTARRMGGGIGSETVKQTVALCLQVGLFDKRLFDRDGVLTSRGIQRRYYAAIQQRRKKEVINEYWLLDDGESKGLVKCALNPRFEKGMPDANGDLQHANDDLQCADGAKSKVKQSKEKQSKEKQSKENSGGMSGGDAFGEAVKAFLDLNPMASQYSLDELKAFGKHFEPGVLLMAISIAADAGKTDWRYTRGILRKYTEAGVRTVEDARRFEQNHRAGQRSGPKSESYSEVAARIQREGQK